MILQKKSLISKQKVGKILAKLTKGPPSSENAKSAGLFVIFKTHSSVGF